MKTIRETIIYIEEILKKKLLKKYYNLINIFNKVKVKKLPSYYSYNYKIKLEPRKKSS